VRFHYRDEPLFGNLSLEIPVGRITALTGPSGAGKTTIADLVVGLVEPEAGEVLVDGRPLGEVDLSSWRRHIGYVPQEMFLLHDSVAMNVGLGDPDISRDDIVRALKDAHAWEFVSQMPEGIDSVVGERGSALSGGQRQRIAIARAMLHDPWLLILDEATTALDPKSEAIIWQALRELRGRTTILAISHQTVLLDVADRVYRIEGGVATAIAASEVRGQNVAAVAHGAS
jgi:ATP-binding cassette subfamily C protein